MRATADLGGWPLGCFLEMRDLPASVPSLTTTGELPALLARAPVAVIDRLRVLATDSEVPFGEVTRLASEAVGLGLPPRGYPAWMTIADGVASKLLPRARAAAFRRLNTQVGAEFEMRDPYVLEFILATLVTIGLPGDPVWGFVVGPPSGLKTEFLRWLSPLPQVYTLSRLTPHSLISGLKDGKSLLPELDGKLLVIKDFTTVLEQDRKARDEVFAQFRDAFDGYFEAYFGSVGKLSFHAHFHVLAGVTSAIEEYWSVQSALGPRFLKVRVPRVDGYERSLALGGREEAVRGTCSSWVKRIADAQEAGAVGRVGFDRAQQLRPIVELLAQGRTHVNRYEGVISSIPEPELVPRVAKQFRKLLLGRAYLHGRTEVDATDIEFARRVAFDTLPLNRALILRALAEPATADDLELRVRLPRATLYRHLQELDALDLVVSDGNRPGRFELAGAACQLGVPPHFFETSASPSLTSVGGEVGGHPSTPPAASALSIHGRGRSTPAAEPPPTELDRAVRLLGPTLIYPDGTVTDRRTGTILHRLRSTPSDGNVTREDQ